MEFPEWWVLSEHLTGGGLENASKAEREGESGAATKSRTRDLLITSQLLYHG